MQLVKANYRQGPDREKVSYGCAFLMSGGRSMLANFLTTLARYNELFLLAVNSQNDSVTLDVFLAASTGCRQQLCFCTPPV